ncbi:MAG: glycoside hydrolase family 10 protein [Gemmatimonadota bacterium]
MTLSALFWTVTPTAAQAPPCGVWIVRNALQSQAEWDTALRMAERLGCRRLYLQASGRWDAYFPSVVFPAPARPPRGAGWVDPFGSAIEEAHARGLEVHVWVNALLAWSAADPPPAPAHVFLRHPEWFVSEPGGGSMRLLSRAELDRRGLVGEGWFLDPGHPAVRTELRRFVLELASRYPIDGVHLDYIRYPTGWAPPGGERAVTRLVELLRYDLRTVRSSAILSAAVMPRPAEALRSFAQHWEAWLAGGLVDEVVPMVYRDTPDAVVSVVRDYPASVERRRVWVGVRIDRLDPDEYHETAGRLGDDGVAGAVLFSHNLIAEDPRWRDAGPVASK